MEKAVEKNKSEPAWVVSENTTWIKPRCFYGSSPLSVFTFQFETVASWNGWDDDEKTLEVILALKGAEVGILYYTVPTSYGKNYNEQILALQCTFGDEHKRELHHMELSCWAQKSNEPL